MSKMAIIETGGKQYLVQMDTVLEVEKLEHKDGPSSAEATQGRKITFDKVLMTDDGSTAKIGAPYISGEKVSAEVVSEGRDAKVTVIRYRPKSRHFVKKGHRQPFTKVKITSL